MSACFRIDSIRITDDTVAVITIIFGSHYPVQQPGPDLLAGGGRRPCFDQRIPAVVAPPQPVTIDKQLPRAREGSAPRRPGYGLPSPLFSEVFVTWKSKGPPVSAAAVAAAAALAPTAATADPSRWETGTWLRSFAQRGLSGLVLQPPEEVKILRVKITI